MSDFAAYQESIRKEHTVGENDAPKYKIIDTLRRATMKAISSNEVYEISKYKTLEAHTALSGVAGLSAFGAGDETAAAFDDGEDAATAEPEAGEAGGWEGAAAVAGVVARWTLTWSR
jgi:hypothetical protein